MPRVRNCLADGIFPLIPSRSPKDKYFAHGIRIAAGEIEGGKCV